MKSTTIRVDEDIQLRLKEFRAYVPRYFESFNEVIKTLLEIAEQLKSEEKLKNYI